MLMYDLLGNGYNVINFYETAGFVNGKKLSINIIKRTIPAI